MVLGSILALSEFTRVIELCASVGCSGIWMMTVVRASAMTSLKRESVTMVSAWMTQ